MPGLTYPSIWKRIDDYLAGGEQAVADYFRTIPLPRDQANHLREVILADLTGRHAQGEVEVAAQRKRLARLERERQS